MLETIQSIFDRQSNSGQLLVAQVIGKAKTYEFVDRVLVAMTKKLVLPIAAEVHPEIPNLEDALTSEAIPDLLIPLEWELIFDRLRVKVNENKSLFSRFLDSTGLSDVIVNLLFGTTLSKKTPKDLKEKTIILLFVAAILRQKCVD